MRIKIIHFIDRVKNVKTLQSEICHKAQHTRSTRLRWLVKLDNESECSSSSAAAVTVNYCRVEIYTVFFDAAADKTLILITFSLRFIAD